MVITSLNILFIGAGKRLSLLERFIAAANTEDIALSMWSIENSRLVPISTVARILIGPKFKDASFGDFLRETVHAYDIHVIIPNMDAATVVVSRHKRELSIMGCWPVVSRHEFCVAMEDKLLAEEWFKVRGFPIPVGRDFPCIAKHRFGFGARDQCLIANDDELHLFFAGRKCDDYIIQPFISGIEYTVDAYVGRDGQLIGALSRQRLEVSAGEVDVSKTLRHPDVLGLTERILAESGWEGPITLQFIEGPAGPLLIEINPRFGGGVTHAIHCGLDMPRWIIREYFGRTLEPFHNWPDGSVMVRCRRDIFQ